MENNKTLIEWFEEGFQLFKEGKFEDVLTHFEPLIEMIKKGQDIADLVKYTAWLAKGTALLCLERYKESIDTFTEALEFLDDKSKGKGKDKDSFYYYRGRVYAITKQYDKAAADFLISGQTVYNVFAMEWLSREEQDQIVDYMIDKDDFFNEVIKDDMKNRDNYKAIYILSNRLLDMLHVTREEEAYVSHYTSKETLRLLLPPKIENSSPIRLQSVIHSNDSSEGQTLMKYLYRDKGYKIEEGDYRALSLSFTFNKDCLNQFRLYGKENGREGTGVSITVDNEFFERETKAPTDKLMLSSIAVIEDETLDASEKPQEEKSSLFRCIYIDSETNQVISVGQREAYTFYRDKSKNERMDAIRKKIKAYQQGTKKEQERNIDWVLTNVQKSLEDLRKIAIKLDSSIVSKLLLNLRYLTKHVAFKEEQECRIVEVKNVITEDKVKPTDKHNQWYIDYNVAMAPHVKEVRFGPHFDRNEADIFKGELAKLSKDIKTKTEEDIKTTISEHPLA
jgi:tetratricopeptide (TPR) repeat protein